VKAVFQGNAQVIATIIGPTQFGWNPDLAPLPYDVEKAKTLLADAGYPDGFEISVGCPAGVFANVSEACQALVGYLNEVGVKATLQMREGGLFYDMIVDHTIDPISFDGAGDRYGDPSFPVGLVLRKDSPYTTWYNDTIHDLLVAGDTTVDQEKRREIYRELQDLMLEDPPCVPLWQVYNYVGVNTRVSDFTVRPNEMMDFRGVGLQQ
jgi:peptide/nickel transport system substrate-binding protein